MKVYEALAQAFIDEGTSAVFGMMGGQNEHWINALHVRGVPVYHVRHEGPGLAMAAAWASITGEPGVCTSTSGPAVTQLATTMVVASRSRIPLVAFCGDTRWGDEAQLHRLDQARFAAAIECGFVRVTSSERTYEAVQRAFYLARLESRPIMLSAPVDIQLGAFDETEEYIPSLSLLTNKPIFPNPETMELATEIVAKSERTVLLIGRGAVRAQVQQAVHRLADRTGALVATSLLAMNWPAEADDYHVGVSGLYSTRAAMELFQEADCLIAVGASLNSYTTANGYLYPNASVVQFDSAPQVVMGDGRAADCYVQCDAQLGLEELDRRLEERSIRRGGFRTPEVRERLATALDDPVTYELEPGTVDPRDACRALDSAIPDSFGLVISGSHAMGMAIMLTRARRPYTLINKQFGSMSKGIAAVIGACVASDKKPTVLIEGDAGFMMHLSEFETAVRYELPLLVVILNDQAAGEELHQAMHKPELDPNIARLPTPDLGLVGVALGGRGYLVRTIDELREAAKEFVQEPGPMIMDVRISTNVDSIPLRRLHGHDEV